MSESLAVALGIGVAFGAVLERTGLGSARQLVKQFHGTDLTVFKVMFSALLTAMLGVFWLGVFGVVNWSALYVPPTFQAPQLVGGLIFGAGFALAGLCPGTSCADCGERQQRENADHGTQMGGHSLGSRMVNHPWGC